MNNGGSSQRAVVKVGAKVHTFCTLHHVMDPRNRTSLIFTFWITSDVVGSPNWCLSHSQKLVTVRLARVLVYCTFYLYRIIWWTLSKSLMMSSMNILEHQRAAHLCYVCVSSL